MEKTSINESVVIQNLKSKDKNIIQNELNNIQKNFKDLKEETLCQIGFILPQIIDTYQHQQIVIPFIKIVHQFIDYQLTHYVDAKELIYQILENIMLFESIHIQNQAKALLRRLLELIEIVDFVKICQQEFQVQQASVLENNLEFLVMGVQEFGGSDLNYCKDLLPLVMTINPQILRRIQESLITCYCELFKYLGSKVLPTLQKQSNYIQNQVFVFMKKWGKKRLQGARQQMFPHTQQSRKNLSTPNRQKLIGKIQQLDVDNFQKMDSLQDKVKYLEELKIDLKNGSYQSGDYSNVLILIKMNLITKSKPLLVQALKCLDLLIKNLGHQFKDTQALFQLILPLYKWKSDSVKLLINKIIIRISKQVKFSDYEQHLKNYLQRNQALLKVNILKIILMIFEEKVLDNKIFEFQGSEQFINEMLNEQLENQDKEVRNLARYILKYFEKNIQYNFIYKDYQHDDNKQVHFEAEKFQDDLEIQEIEEEDEVTDSYVKQRKQTAKDVLSFLQSGSLRQSVQLRHMGHSQSSQAMVSPHKQSKLLPKNKTQKILHNVSKQSKKSMQKSKSKLNESIESNENDTSIDWDKRPQIILTQILQQTQKKRLDVVQTNQILHNLQKQTSDFMSVQNDKKFKQFLEQLCSNSNIDINVQSLTYLRKIICQMIIRKKNLMVYEFLHKIIQVEGPLELIQFLLKNLQKKGFKENYFLEIFFKLYKKIPKEYLFVEHSILIYRHLYMFYQQDEICQNFINYIANILKPDLHWLQKQYPELMYLDPVEIQEEQNKFEFNPNLKKSLEKELKLISNYKTKDFNQDIERLLDQSKNTHQKKSILDKMFSMMLKHPKISLNQQNQNKLQKLWAVIAQDLKNNKNLLLVLSKIIYLYFHTMVQDQNLIFLQGSLDDLIKILLKQKSENTRTFFSRALRIHMHNENEKNLLYYFNLLTINSAVLQEDLIQLIFDKIDSMDEKKIQKIDKNKILPILFNLVQSKNQTISEISKELAEFLLAFLDQKQVQKIAKQHSSEAEKLIKQYYKENGNYQEISFVNEQQEGEQKLAPVKPNSSYNQRQNKKILEKSFQNAPKPPDKQDLTQNAKIVEKFLNLETLEQFDYAAFIQNYEIVAENVFEEETYQLYVEIVQNKNVINLNQLLEKIELTITSEILLKQNVALLILVFQLKMLQAYKDMPSIHKIVFEQVQLLLLSLNHLDKNFTFSFEEFQTIQTIFHNLNFDDKSYKIMKHQLLLRVINTNLSTQHQTDISDNIINSKDIKKNCYMILDDNQNNNLSLVLPIPFYFFFGSINQILEILTSQEDDINDLENYYFSLLFILARVKVTIKLGLKENVEFTLAILNEIFQLLDTKNKVPERLIKKFFQIMLQFLNEHDYKQSIQEIITKFFMVHNMPKEVYFLSKLLFDKKKTQKLFEQLFFEYTESLKIEEIAHNAQEFQKSLIFNAVGDYYYNFNLNYQYVERNEAEIELMDNHMDEWLESLKQLIYNGLIYNCQKKFLIQRSTGQIPLQQR